MVRNSNTARIASASVVNSRIPKGPHSGRKVKVIKQGPKETSLLYQKLGEQSPKKLQPHSRESVTNANSWRCNFPAAEKRSANWESYGQGPRFPQSPSEQENSEKARSPPSKSSKLQIK
ncbi:hypothetical protein K0M31_000651 [Melipona bicolor]|uniref:Uncharacterized protein n=1 Tax=Melipona bicolor TaxID=60889 RepID=A0AA40KX90_9HYME|nr:hypothetical protein K0M31_000651 [Melipona bicolor]